MESGDLKSPPRVQTVKPVASNTRLSFDPVKHVDLNVEIPYELRPVTPAPDTCEFCAGSAPRPSWDFVRAVYCISLADREDRQNKAAEELHRVGLCGIAQHYLSERPKVVKGDGWGCFVSHKQVAQHALQQNWSHPQVLVLEDDFVFDEDVPVKEISQRVAQALSELPANYTRLQLGYQPYVSLPHGSTTRRSLSAFTHAIVWSKLGLEWMASMRYRHMYHDFQLGISLPRSYDIAPMLCFQRVLGTDNTSSWAETLFTNPTMMKRSVWTFPLMITLGALLVLGLVILLATKILPTASWWRLLTFSVITVMLPVSIVLTTVALT